MRLYVFIPTSFPLLELLFSFPHLLQSNPLKNSVQGLFNKLQKRDSKKKVVSMSSFSFKAFATFFIT